MFTVIAVAVVVLIAALLVYAAMKPDTFHIERSAGIAAPAEKIFPLINDLRSQITWVPFEQKDPALARSFGAVTAGPGAVYEWKGNRHVGQGRIEITDTSPPNKVAMKLDMLKPFQAHNIVEFTLAPNGAGTTVTWAMHGPQPYLAKLMGTLMNCDKMMGGEFEKGLASLKAIAER